MVEERALSWDDEINYEERSFITLPEGDYDFEVVDFERARHPGSERLPACNMAVLKIRLSGEAGSTTIQHRLFLHTRTQGFLSEFFVAIGQMRKGESIRMNWNAVVGSRGRCKVGIRKWVGDDGQERTSNEILRFYAPGEAQPTTQLAATSGYQAGRF